MSRSASPVVEYSHYPIDAYNCTLPVLHGLGLTICSVPNFLHSDTVALFRNIIVTLENHTTITKIISPILDKINKYVGFDSNSWTIERDCQTSARLTVNHSQFTDMPSSGTIPAGRRLVLLALTPMCVNFHSLRMSQREQIVLDSGSILLIATRDFSPHMITCSVGEGEKEYLMMSFYHKWIKNITYYPVICVPQMTITSICFL
jgi:hypothetical protein